MLYQKLTEEQRDFSDLPFYLCEDQNEEAERFARDARADSVIEQRLETIENANRSSYWAKKCWNVSGMLEFLRSLGNERITAAAPELNEAVIWECTDGTAIFSLSKKKMFSTSLSTAEMIRILESHRPDEKSIFCVNGKLVSVVSLSFKPGDGCCLMCM